MLKLCKKYFDEVKVSYRATMIEDQPDFKFSKIFKSSSIFRGIKRAISNYILYSVYFNCQSPILAKKP